MRKRKVEINLNDEKGSGLVLALMVLLVLSVLGATLGVVTIGSLQISDVSRDSNSAYYIAEAGANMAYEEFEEIVSNTYQESDNKASFFTKITTAFKEKDYDNFASQFGDTPTATVSVEEPTVAAVGEEREYVIKSVGEVNGKDRVVVKPVTVIWKDKPTTGGVFSTIPAGAAVIAKNEIELRPGKITGDSYIISDKQKVFKFNNAAADMFQKVFTNYIGEPQDIYDINGWFSEATLKKFYSNTFNPMTEVIDWDSFDKYIKALEAESSHYKDKFTDENGKSTDELSIGENQEILITENYKLKKLNLKGKNTINIGSNDIVLNVEEFKKVNYGTTTVIGDGTLTVLVTDIAQLNGDAIISQEAKNNIKIVFNKSFKNKTIEIAGNAKYESQIIAPYTEVKIGGSGKVFGNVIAESVKLSGSGRITYKSFTSGGSGSGVDQEEVNTEDLITPGPTIESD